MVLKWLDPAIQPAMKEVRAQERTLLDQEFYLPLRVDKILRELRRLCIPGILGSSRVIDKSQQAFRLAGSKYIVVVKKVPAHRFTESLA